MEDDLSAAKKRINELVDELQLLKVTSDERYAKLEERYRSLADKNALLEEECDLLASEIDRLRSKPAVQMQSASSFSVEVDALKSFEHLAVDGSGKYAALETLRINDICGALNPLCAAYALCGDAEVAVVGGADKTLKIVCLDKSIVLHTYSCASPVISVDAWRNRVFFGCMDGSVGLATLTDKLLFEDPKYYSPSRKYVVGVQWCPEGRYAASVSHDKTVTLFRCEDSSSSVNLTVVTVITLDVTPESVSFALVRDISDIGGSQFRSNDAVLHLIIASRTYYLLYVNCESLAHYRVSLNVNDWDTHCSFAVLHMAVSPDGSMLLLATDKHLLLLLEVGTSKRLRVFSGHSSGDFARPKVAWDMSGKYIYSNSDVDSFVYVYSVGTGKIVDILKHHKIGMTRSVCAHRYRHSILTTGSDKSFVECSSAVL